MSEIFALRQMWNNLLRKLWNLMLTHQVKWNKSTHAHRHFTLRSNISHAKRISQIPQWIYFVEKDRNCDTQLRSFSGGDGEIRTLAPVTQPTPLAGAPLEPLEYVSEWFNYFKKYLIKIVGGESGIRTHGSLRNHWFSRPAP